MQGWRPREPEMITGPARTAAAPKLKQGPSLPAFESQQPYLNPAFVRRANYAYKPHKRIALPGGVTNKKEEN